MSDAKKRKTERAPRDEAPEAPEAPAEERGPAAAEAARPPDAAGTDAATAEKAEAEAAELRDRLLRTMAELENFRRRAAREREDTARYAIANFARDCLSVLDNLRRGLDSVDAREREHTPALRALAEGMELTERELAATLERHGVAPIEAMGRPFDHNLHEAMFEVNDASVPAGTVVQVLQDGYTLHDRLLRPARVGVARGGARAEAAEKPVQAPIANEDLAHQPPDAAGAAPGDGEPAGDGKDGPSGDDGPGDTRA